MCDVTLGVGLTGVAHVGAAVGDFVLAFLILDQALDVALEINQDRVTACTSMLYALNYNVVVVIVEGKYSEHLYHPLRHRYLHDLEIPRE